MNERSFNAVDRVLSEVDKAMRTVWASHTSSRPYPGAIRDGLGEAVAPLSELEKREAAALMRVNHVGEVCAQALYSAQAMTAHDPKLKAQLEQAAAEETDHLAWTEQRLRELGGRTSWLNPLWYAGAYGLGLVAGRVGPSWSLGFVVETERQVEQHLNSHLDRLPPHDAPSRAVVEQMRDDEVRHAEMAQRAGGRDLPEGMRRLMRAAAKVMTLTAHRI